MDNITNTIIVIVTFIVITTKVVDIIIIVIIVIINVNWVSLSLLSSSLMLITTLLISILYEKAHIVQIAKHRETSTWLCWLILGPFYTQRFAGVMTRISNYIHSFLCELITYDLTLAQTSAVV